VANDTFSATIATHSSIYSVSTNQLSSGQELNNSVGSTGCSGEGLIGSNGTFGVSGVGVGSSGFVNPHEYPPQPNHQDHPDCLYNQSSQRLFHVFHIIVTSSLLSVVITYHGNGST